jgi:hypothetical protein
MSGWSSTLTFGILIHITPTRNASVKGYSIYIPLHQIRFVYQRDPYNDPTTQLITFFPRNATTNYLYPKLARITPQQNESIPKNKVKDLFQAKG